jgi:hypothetical protein
MALLIASIVGHEVMKRATVQLCLYDLLPVKSREIGHEVSKLHQRFGDGHKNWAGGEEST